uniref:C2 domain-containing protein n=1 Tax=Alexandrium monilatum TaxID=311494 RepID=A0A7S4UWR5_9DINO
MGCACGKNVAAHVQDPNGVVPSGDSRKKPRTGRATSVTVRLKNAVEVIRKDVFSESDPYVEITAVANGQVLATSTSKVAKDTANPVWNSDHRLSGSTEWDPKKTTIKFSVWDKDVIGSQYIGQADISMEDFIETPDTELLVHDGMGNPVLGTQAPHWPTALRVSLDTRTLPVGWPSPPTVPPPKTYERHIFMITRGTRGDVQPFVALARGLAQYRGWLVTICTELRWKSFVLSNARDVSPGRICFVDSGGDTEARVNSALGQWATKQKSEFMQLMMLANSEAEFFNSATVVMRRLTDLQASPTPVHMVTYGFTVASIGLMVSEKHQLPHVGFFLQPSSIPSRDPNWTAVQAINTHGVLSLIDSIEEKTCTSHDVLGWCKTFAEKNPFAFFNRDKIRGWFDLPAADTYATLRSRGRPIVIPMRRDTFERPSDWWDKIIMTDFIFLRSGAGGSNSLGEPLDGFIERAREAGANLALMTFSSMPVARATVLRCAIKMVKECAFNLRLIYAGKRQLDFVPEAVEACAKALSDEGRFIEVEKADFGVLFPHMDIFIVHGGLGTTVEALRMKRPTCVTGPLLLDQRFWGSVCHQKGVGMPPVHIDNFEQECLKFVNGALDPADPEGWRAKAQEQDWGDTAEDGVKANVDCIAQLLQRHEERSGFESSQPLSEYTL